MKNSFQSNVIKLVISYSLKSSLPLSKSSRKDGGKYGLTLWRGTPYHSS
jgi:hypothetical protein